MHVFTGDLLPIICYCTLINLLHWPSGVVPVTTVQEHEAHYHAGDLPHEQRDRYASLAGTCICVDVYNFLLLIILVYSIRAVCTYLPLNSFSPDELIITYISYNFYFTFGFYTCTYTLGKAMEGSTGLPVGVQIVTRAWKDEQCLGIMKDLEDVIQFNRVDKGNAPRVRDV